MIFRGLNICMPLASLKRFRLLSLQHLVLSLLAGGSLPELWLVPWLATSTLVSLGWLVWVLHPNRTDESIMGDHSACQVVCMDRQCSCAMLTHLVLALIPHMFKGQPIIDDEPRNYCNWLCQCFISQMGRSELWHRIFDISRMVLLRLAGNCSIFGSAETWR